MYFESVRGSNHTIIESLSQTKAQSAKKAHKQTNLLKFCLHETFIEGSTWDGSFVGVKDGFCVGTGNGFELKYHQSVCQLSMMT